MLPDHDISLPRVNLKSNMLSDLEKALKNEWLVTNGLGGYASSTVLGLNTRKYHGLLVAAFDPPVNRHVLLARLDEEISLNNQKFFFGANESSSGIQTEGFQVPNEFSLAPFPSYTYRVDPLFQFKKTIFMPHEKNASVVLYEMANISEKKAKVLIAPLVNSRNFHWVTQRDQFSWASKTSNQSVIIQPSNGLSALMLFSPEGRYVAGRGEWVENYFRAEAMRGESNVDYSFKPGFFTFDVEPSETKSFAVLAVGGKTEHDTEAVFSSINKDYSSIATLYDTELKRRIGLLNSFNKQHKGIQFEDWLKWLVLAADSFLVSRESTKAKSVIAGYHWFNDWGRDSLISLPGLTLVTGRYEDAKRVLLTFAHYCREGLVPNSFSDSAGGAPVYNTVDATLWFFNAVLQYLKYTGDFQFVKETLWATLESIVEHHVHGTLFDVHVDEDGLVAHGPQLTWMDAAPEGTPIKPRDGKAVEIQALWYNALKIMQVFANRFGQEEKAEKYRLLAEKAQRSFVKKFWNPHRNCLFDVVGDSKKNFKDDSLRPNQILAVSLDYTMLDKTKAELVVAAVWKHLLTPYGLKTLANSDSRYIGRYGGNRWQRDRAYHNGTVWPWLLGPFITAFLKLKNHEVEWRNFAFENFLKPLFKEELYRASLGSISEIFDGDLPHEPNGCIAQAWSVAEPLRAYMEDVLLRRPPYEQQTLSSQGFKG